MVYRSRARSSSLFLMELILAILFFSVASAVCVQFFVKSHLMSRDSEVLARAVNECSGAAEIICTSDGMKEGLDMLRQQYPEGDYDTPVMEEGLEETASRETDSPGEADAMLYYDDSFAPCGQETAAYVLEIHMEQDEQMIEAALEMRSGSDDEEEDGAIYRLQTKHHIARRTDGSER